MSTYPLTLTRQQLVEADACEDGLKDFDESVPDGVLQIADATAHSALLAPLGQWESWCIDRHLLPPVVVAAGNRGAATAGYRGTAIVGDRGSATAGDYGVVVAGRFGSATAGYRGSATAGRRGSATAGNRGAATAGYRGTATAGDDGTATVGEHGSATAGYRGILQWRCWDGRRMRIHTAYVGEDGIEPNVPYRCRWVDGAAVVERATTD